MLSFRGMAMCIAMASTVVFTVTARAAAPVEKWEYAELHHHERLVTTRADGSNASFVEWVTVNGLITGADWDGMAEKLNAPAVKPATLKEAKNESIVVHRLRVFNQIGDQSWELVTHNRDAERGDDLWTFKRSR
jgi:hypothetical protein